MRSDDEMISLILNVAETDDRIRAVLLNGSRANQKVKKDKFQDFDIVYIVNEIESFLSNHTWIDIFGERLILQMPQGMAFEEEVDGKETVSFHYLMLFKDGNRIDLTMFPFDKLKSEFEKDSLTIVLLDKDNLLKNFPISSDSDYLIKRPTEKEFLDCCNEFWWVSTYVVKGLWRKEIIYAKNMFEGTVRTMFMKLIEWHIGIITDFSVSYGKNGKNIKEYISPALYDKVLSTYPNANSDNIWSSLFIMTEIFSELASGIGQSLNFKYNLNEDNKVTEYLKWIYILTKKK